MLIAQWDWYKVAVIFFISETEENKCVTSKQDHFGNSSAPKLDNELSKISFLKTGHIYLINQAIDQIHQSKNFIHLSHFTLYLETDNQ